MRYVSIDIETTGLDPDTCEIIEFAAVLDNGDAPPVSELDTFRFRVKKPTYKGEPYALSMHSELFKTIAESSPDYTKGNDLIGPPYMLGRTFGQWLKSKGVPSHNFNTVGKNFANFDARFLNRMETGRSCFQWNHRILDPASMYVRRKDNALPNTAECIIRALASEAFRNDYKSLKGEKHTALYDAQVVVALTREGLRGTWRKQC
jgi:DNA polymerase III epsilon subunit-like protein